MSVLQKIQEAVFKREDPSKHYEVISRITTGAYGQIFKAQRLDDGKFFALKFMQPKNEEDFRNIKNEVGIMMMCKEEDYIVKCVDAFDYKERLWVFLELMDVGALTHMLE